MRRRVQQAAEALHRANDYHPSGAATGTLNHNNNAAPASLFGGPDQAFVPSHGRGGAGSRSRDRSSSQARGSSANRGRPTGSPAVGGSPSRSRTTSMNPPGDLQRGRSPASRRGPAGNTEQPAATGGDSAPAGQDASTPQSELPPPHNAPPLPLVDVPVIQPEHTSIGLTRPPAIIRGVMTVSFSKSTRVKKIGIRLKGQSKTEWPEVRLVTHCWSTDVCFVSLTY